MELFTTTKSKNTFYSLKTEPNEQPWCVFPKELIMGNKEWKSDVEFAGIHMKTHKKFNWLQRKMLKTFFGITITKYEKKK